MTLKFSLLGSGERDRRHGQAALGRAAAAPALARPDAQRHAGPEPGARAGARRDHAHHRRRARLPAARRQLVPRAPLPGGGRAAPARGARPHRRQGAAAATASPAPIVRRALETGEVVSTRSRGEAAELDRCPAAPTRTRSRSRRSCACPCARPAPGPMGGSFPARARRALRRQRRLGRALQRRRAARRRGARAPRRTRDRERPAVRARAAHDRGAAEAPEAAAAVGEARHHRPDGRGHRPRAQHAAHLHHGQPGAARAAGSFPRPARDALVDRPRVRADPRAGPAPARLQPARPRGDGAALRQRRRRAHARAVPVPDRERARVARQGADAGPAPRARDVEPARDGAHQPGGERGARDGREGRHAPRRHATRGDDVELSVADEGPGIPDRVRRACSSRS